MDVNKYEQDIESNLEKHIPLSDEKSEMDMLFNAAKNYLKNKT